MKRVIFTTLSLVLLLTACKKSDLTAPEDTTATPNTVLPASPPPALPGGGLVSSIQSRNVTVTDWEPAGTWLRTTGGNNTLTYATTRSFQEMTREMSDKGTLLVFSKGYNFADEGSNLRPMGMPFYFYLPTERIDFPVSWAYGKKPGSVGVSLEMKADAAALFAGARDRIRLRYFLLAQAELQRRGLTADAVHNLGYSQLTTMFGLTP